MSLAVGTSKGMLASVGGNIQLASADTHMDLRVSRIARFRSTAGAACTGSATAAGRTAGIRTASGAAASIGPRFCRGRVGFATTKSTFGRVGLFRCTLL